MLAIACASRHVGIALVVAVEFVGVRTAVVVVAYFVIVVVSFEHIFHLAKTIATTLMAPVFDFGIFKTLLASDRLIIGSFGTSAIAENVTNPVIDGVAVIWLEPTSERPPRCSAE